MARAALDILVSLLSLLAGLVVAFSGYSLGRRLSALTGFLAGFVLGLAVGLVAGPLGSLVVGLLLGALFAVLFVFAFRLAGGAVGGVGAYALAAMLGWPTWAIVLSVVVGVLVGLAANRIVLIGATALLGASMAVKGGAELLGDVGIDVPDPQRTLLLAATLVLAALGAFVQWRRARHEG